MARYYSEHYAHESTSAVAPATSIPNVRLKTVPGLHRVPMMVSRCRVHLGAAPTLVGGGGADTICLMPIRSSDRIWGIRGYWASGGLADAFAGDSVSVDLGLAPPSQNHDAAPWESNALCNNCNLLASKFEFNMLTENSNPTNSGIGLYAWELANLHDGGPSYTEDPRVSFDLIATMKTVTNITAQGRITIEVLFSTAGS